MKSIDRSEIQSIISNALTEFNKSFKSQFKKPLWAKFDHLFDKGLLFSGSTRPFFAKYISDEEFQTKKPLVGDQDLMFDEKLNDELKTFLITSKGKQFGQLRYVDRGGNSPTQENTLFELPEKFWDRIRYIQIDFEPVPFENDIPTEFSIFAHYSSWKDISEGIKGVFVKYLYRSLFTNLEKISNYVIQTDTGKLSKSKKFEQEIGKYKFSVDRGVRIAFEPVLENGKQKIIDGKQVFREIETKESTYEQSLSVIFSLVFKRLPVGSDLNKMKSFIGVLDIMKDSKIDHKTIYLDFTKLLWDDGAQGLERNNPEMDFENKKAAHDKFVEIFPDLYSLDKKIQTMIETYYKTYR